ncbi:M24 family metallopeptidase [Bradyrhizobium sp. 164]|uniref:M24 family metallopeptidase n=1 Tax=Bradyrhizobium sp. 164 TaxID=2782637 RepID=UPI001FF8A927|nr:M24 family metallopeptidase [Bradyrhizobium sp. 164]MCK1596009.1 aminopeptidase P family protein [Bradyrhizobium sp. 164]
MRIIKSPAEIDCIREAAVVVEAGVKAGLERTSAGMTERDLAGIVFAEIIRAGGESPFSGVIISGDRGDVIHGGFTDWRLAEGDQIYFEPTGIKHKYSARIMRTAIAGKPSARQISTAEALIRVQDDGFAMMKAGAIAADIHEAFRKRYWSRGFERASRTKRVTPSDLTFGHLRPSSLVSGAWNGVSHGVHRERYRLERNDTDHRKGC